TPFNKLISELATEQIENGNLPRLTKTTGLSKHWFYEVSKGNTKDPRTSTVIKFLDAIDHPLSQEIQKHIKSEAA
ncbi:MAG: hypothetical protein ACPGUD_14775, partial [Parashewanella sp.]